MTVPKKAPTEPHEETSLLTIEEDTEEKETEGKCHRWCRLLFTCLSNPWTIGVTAVWILVLVSEFKRHPRSPFPPEFVWGTATSSYQVEGAVQAGGRGPTIWDTFCDVDGHIIDGSSGEVACDHYHRVREDVELMHQLGMKAYRFSISWSRIFPLGRGTVPNPQGIAFYRHLINTLLDHGIEPWVTLYHWDLPQALEDMEGGWLNPSVVDDFGEYARVCFAEFGSRVQHWITINEPWSIAVQGYQDGTKAPGNTGDPMHNVYLVAHNLLLAHARAASIYHTDFEPFQHGKIGISNCGDFRYPKDASKEVDVLAAERAMIFQFAWFTDPLFRGDYPSEMKEILEDRLPEFTWAQKKALAESTDFIGLNHYSTLYASVPIIPLLWGGYWTDMHVEFSSDPTWKTNDMGWSTNPDGCRELLLWIAQRYPTVPIVMTENGTAEKEPNVTVAVHDEGRRSFMEGYLKACGEAVQLGVPLQGYFAWSLMDNFEWEYGYTKKFGLCHVDFETMKRTPKKSALWYKETIALHGTNLGVKVPRRQTLPHDDDESSV
eukprot:Nitzschia sp. Nitz4//scaffold179_size51476//9505//11145//NITZ4_006921-RA/size51476-processed-gene-0.40-mRNA-1//1//CDS//3329539201//6299//frame0